MSHSLKSAVRSSGLAGRRPLASPMVATAVASSDMGDVGNADAESGQLRETGKGPKGAIVHVLGKELRNSAQPREVSECMWESGIDGLVNGNGNHHSTDELVVKLVEQVTLVSDESDVDALLQKIVSSQRTKVVSFVNANALNLCYQHEDFLDSLLQSDYLLRDGKGMEMLYKSIGKDPGLNLNGTDLIPRFLPLLEGKRVALLGTTETFLDNAARRLAEQGVDVVLKVDGFRDTENYLPLVEASRPDFIIMGMGMPKQERVSVFLKRHLTKPCVIVNGGAILDFWGGKVRRAPPWFREHGLEWLFRLMMEPRRLFRRYVIGNVLFMWRARRLQSIHL